jgi:hypothetical protein
VTAAVPACDYVVGVVHWNFPSTIFFFEDFTSPCQIEHYHRLDKMPSERTNQRLSLPPSLLRQVGGTSQPNKRRKPLKSDGRPRKRRRRLDKDEEAHDLDNEDVDDSGGDDDGKSFADTRRETRIAPPPSECPLDEPPKRCISKAVREKFARDDAEIARLEQKLGLKGRNSKSLPKSFKEDGLEGLLMDLGDDSDSDGQTTLKSTAEADEWLALKRQKAVRETHHIEDTDDSGSLRLRRQ